MTAGPVPHAEGGAPDDQSEVVAFLSRPDIHPGRGSVTVIQTHGALVFLAGDVALKIKRAVRYDYMEGNRFRHTAQFRRWRPDRDPESCGYEQLDEPVSYDLGRILGVG